MKLGTETGSLVNSIMTNGRTSIEPEIGMGATVAMWSDRRACTVIAWNGETLTVQEDTSIRTDNNGMSDAQSYRYEKNELGARHHFRRDKHGKWQELSTSQTGRLVMVKGGHGLILNARMTFHDYSF